MIDFHSHIIPGIDDGSQSFDITREMLNNAKKQGISHICATSHYIYGEFEQQKENYDMLFARVNDIGQEIGIDIIKGLEVYITPNLVKLYDKGDIWGLNEGKYMLIELPMREFPLYTEDVFYELRLKGVTPIIAHPERNFKIANNVELLVKLVEQGNLAQVNAGSLTGLYGNTIKEVSHNLIRRNLIHMVGSDAHNNNKRNTDIEKAFGTIKEINLDLYNWIKSNELKIINSEDVNPIEVTKYKKTGFFSRILKKSN